MKQVEDSIDEKRMADEAAILSMTPKERQIRSSQSFQEKRIAAGAGVDISEVKLLVKQFDQSRENDEADERNDGY